MADIRDKLNQEWTENMINTYLGDLFFWLRKGQIFTDEQKAKIRELAERVEQND